MKLRRLIPILLLFFLANIGPHVQAATTFFGNVEEIEDWVTPYRVVIDGQTYTVASNGSIDNADYGKCEITLNNDGEIINIRPIPINNFGYLTKSKADQSGLEDQYSVWIIPSGSASPVEYLLSNSVKVNNKSYGKHDFQSLCDGLFNQPNMIRFSSTYDSTYDVHYLRYVYIEEHGTESLKQVRYDYVTSCFEGSNLKVFPSTQRFSVHKSGHLFEQPIPVNLSATERYDVEIFSDGYYPSQAGAFFIINPPTIVPYPEIAIQQMKLWEDRFGYAITAYLNDTSSTCAIYCALYDNNRLIGINKHLLMDSETDFTGFISSLPENKNNLKFKIFFWSPETNIPYCASISPTLPEVTPYD